MSDPLESPDPARPGRQVSIGSSPGRVLSPLQDMSAGAICWQCSIQHLSGGCSRVGLSQLCQVGAVARAVYGRVTCGGTLGSNCFSVECLHKMNEAELPAYCSVAVVSVGVGGLEVAANVTPGAFL